MTNRPSLPFSTKITYIFLLLYTCKFYSQHIQYEEIGLLYIGFFPNSFLFDVCAAINSKEVDLLVVSSSVDAPVAGATSQSESTSKIDFLRGFFQARVILVKCQTDFFFFNKVYITNTVANSLKIIYSKNSWRFYISYFQ